MSTLYRYYQATDEGALVRLWNLCLPQDPVNQENFRHKVLFDPNLNREGFWVAEEGGHLVGAGLGLVRRAPLGDLGLEPERGWISFLFVHPEFRRLGIGRALLQRLMDFFRARQRRLVQVVGYAPYYFFPGVDPQAYPAGLSFFKASGFAKAFEAVAMARSLEGFLVPEEVRERTRQLRQDGFEVGFWRPEDTLPLLEFARREFPGWYPSVLDGLQRGLGHKIVVARQGQEIVGFTQWENSYNDPPQGAAGRFGPFGVSPALRSRGLGAVIFYHLVEAVRQQGARYLWLGWAGGRNVNFYLRAGLQATRRYEILKRELT